MDNEAIEVVVKITSLLAIAVGVGFVKRSMSAAVRVNIGFAALLGCVAVTMMIYFAPEQSVVIPMSPLPISDINLMSQQMVSTANPGSRFDYSILFWLTTGLWVSLVVVRQLRARVELGRLAKVDSQDLIWAKRQLHSTRNVRMVEHDLSGSTFTYGIFRSHIAVPADFESWSAEKRQTALLHELVHIARNDYLVLCVAHLVAAFLWWHPLAWIVVRNLKRDVERACDDEVLARDEDLAPTTYAQYLLDIASQRKRKLAPEPLVPMAAPSALRSRIAALVDTQQRRTIMRRSKQITILVFGSLMAGLMGLVQADGGPDRRYMPVYKTLPVYPKSAEDQKLEGWVLLEFDVAATGATTNIEVVDSTDSIFDQAAVDAVSKFRYLPERSNGQLINVEGVRNKVTFSLSDETDDAETDLERTLQAAEKQKFVIQREIEAAAWEAEQAEDGDRLLDLANMSLDHNIGLASHLLLRARDFGVADPAALQLATGIAFYKQGDLAKSVAEFTALASGSSAHSGVAQQWQTYVERESVRRAVVHEALSAR